MEQRIQGASARMSRSAQPGSIGFVGWLTAPRPIPLLLLVAFAIGAAQVLTMLPVRLLLGTSSFWHYPAGTVAGSQNDMAQELVGYLRLVRGPWVFPLLRVPGLRTAEGINAFWLDPVPWLGLVGRIGYDLTGAVVNLLGLYCGLAFALPGVALTWLLTISGRRGLATAASAALVADSAPFLLNEWGHIALCGQAVCIAALGLYRLSLRHPGRSGIALWWDGLLALTFLTHLYLFVMVGGIWTAGIVQRLIDRPASRPVVMREAVAAVAMILLLGLVTGILSLQDRFGGAGGFGVFSLNLASPVIPQLSGVFPPLRHYWIGMHSQVLGYVGAGGLVLLVAAAPAAAREGRELLRRHGALTLVMTGFVLFALSDVITFGSHVLMRIPLSPTLGFAIGAFRASGRFIWPVDDAAIALAMLLVQRSYRPHVVVTLMLAAGLLQLVDAAPLRHLVARSAQAPVAAVLNRPAVAQLIAMARAVEVYPTTNCIGTDQAEDLPGSAGYAIMTRAVLEIEIAAAWRGLPINAATNSRVLVDCGEQLSQRRRKRRSGVAYFYLDRPDLVPDRRDSGCEQLDAAIACLSVSRPRNASP